MEGGTESVTMEEKWMRLFNKKTNYDETLKRLKEDFEKNWSHNFPSPYGGLDETYDQIQVIGAGSFGTVKLCKNVKTNRYIAVKILIKEFLVKQKQIQHVCQEKRVLNSVCFPFLIYLEFSLKDNTYLYLGLPFINGGEMYYYHRKVKKFNEKQARFYAAQIFLALEYLHNSNIIYRDLKPENMLLDNKGYIKITDFGFCKRIDGRTWTLCGTPEYLAPEIIRAKPYGKSVDWWAFGILVYEFVAGYSPFYTSSSDPMSMYEKICALKYKMPAYFSTDLKNLVQSLLELDVTKRIGDLKNGTKDIKEHPWFINTNWIAILSQEMESFYVPKIRDANDVTNFEKFPDMVMQKAKVDKYTEQFAEF